MPTPWFLQLPHPPTTLLLLLISNHHANSLVSPTSTSTNTFMSKHNNATDRQALVSFKSKISSSPRGPLVSWNDSIHFCQWLGVTCGRHRHPQRVVSLTLSSLELDGFISPVIANLTFLRKIDLSDNQIQGSIPQEMSRLSWLQHLNLSMNSLEGGIPATLFYCSQLQIISLRSNMLQREIPSNLGNCSGLQIVSLRDKNLRGHIPLSLTNLSSLSFLYMSNNKLSGSIPSSLGKLSKLLELSLSNNSLSGSIPPSLGNLSSLVYLQLARNNLSGGIPPIMASQPSLTALYLSTNKLSGSIPMSLSNASRLEGIDLSENMFGGTIPSNLGSLQNLRGLFLELNNLEAPEPRGWDFLTTLANCTHLEILQLSANNLGGMLPNSIANLSTDLYVLTMEDNYISGKIPAEIRNLVGLEIFIMGSNLLTGSIPASIGMLQNLHLLNLNGNKLSKQIPSTIGNLSQLNYLYLDSNELSGNIPSTLGNCQNVELLNLAFNKLTGVIPKEVVTIPRLSRDLYLASNALTGPIPAEIGNFRNMGIIDVSMNKLSGEIPSSLSQCQVLEELHLGGNFIQGSIPSSLSSLRGIQVLDVSKNSLSGKIPDFLQDFRGLSYLNLSFNNFEGEMPRLGIFKNSSAVSVIGNNKLCGGNLEMHLPACTHQSPNKNHDFRTLGTLIVMASSVPFLIVLFCFLSAVCWMLSSRKKTSCSTPVKEQHEKISYAELVKATNGFSTENVIGTGSFGTVYKGILDEDKRKVVAVKVLNLETKGASKSFIAECEALSNIRHRNLIKILITCSSVDFRGNDFKAMIFEFMVNDSLDAWLYPKENDQVKRRKLNLRQRLNIAIDVASALDYLHHQCGTPIIHSDLKPSNILLDGEMTAHVGDFGQARILEEMTISSSEHSTSSVGLKGTIGYIPPEHGMGNKVSTRGDVYSYGIFLLEMFTAKRPTDDTFLGLSLRKYVEMAFPERITDVIDPHLLTPEDGEKSDHAQNKKFAGEIECIASVLGIGLSCSNELPAERMEMGKAIRELHKARDVLLRNGNFQETEAERS